MTFRYLAISSVIAFLAWGCTTSGGDSSIGGSTEISEELSEKKVLVIAKEEAQRRGFDYSEDIKDIDVRFEDGYWWVFMFAKDIKKHGRIGILISTDGKIVRFFKNL